MDRKEVMELFNKRPRIGALSTANSKGNVNVAAFGSLRMIDENTVVMATGENRSFQYLKENPKAAFIIMEPPGEKGGEWKGMRVYLEVTDIEQGGRLFDEIREDVEKRVGKQATNRLQAAVRFKIAAVRPLIDPL
ncbi:MAG: pyridoxamine 5'-phosphate oxidase family protein [Deltaproteobacteria bacterium]